jgi:RHS repeat-associated protein
MAMTAQLSENSHQGFDGLKAALCLGAMEAKSNTASGMPVCLWREGIRSRSTGKERDAETGLDYFGARYYSGAQGRFTSADQVFADQHPRDPQSWNLYAYVRNNPLSHVDPNGRGDVSAIAWGILKGTGSFIYNSTPIPGAVQAVKDLTNLRAAAARQEAQSGALISGIKALGSAEGRAGLVNAAKGAWNNMSTSDKAATVTEVGLGIATAVAGGVAMAGGKAANSARGMSQFGGIMESQVNAAGGTVYTSTGLIGQDVVGSAVNSALTGGATDINILSGVHGAADGTMTAAPEFFLKDVAKFGDIPEVTVYDLPTMSTDRVNQMVNGPGTTIGAFCNSGACLPPVK